MRTRQTISKGVVCYQSEFLQKKVAICSYYLETMYFTILFKCWLSIAGEYDRTTFLFELALLSRGVIATQKKSTMLPPKHMTNLMLKLGISLALIKML